MTDQIEANYEVLQQVINKFEQLHDQAGQMRQSLSNSFQALQDTWTGEGFDAFAKEADQVTGPATKRLEDAMHEAAVMTKLIAQTFHDADEECSGGFKIPI